MGQPAFASAAALSNAALFAPEMLAFTSRWLSVTVKPASVFSNVTVHLASMLWGVMLAFPSSLLRAMAKHPAWAAAMSSSGLVPTPFSNRVLNEYWVLESTPLAVETVPLPSLSPPFHCALAVRCMLLLLEKVVRNHPA